jgi:hypothetical protein
MFSLGVLHSKVWSEQLKLLNPVQNFDFSDYEALDFDQAASVI